MDVNAATADPAAKKGAVTWRWRIGLALVLVLGGGLRIRAAATEAVQGDELFTRDVASGSIRAAVAMILDDKVHPPLHYLVAKTFGAVTGTTPEALRVASVLSGILLVAGVAFLARSLYAGVWLALLPAALIALSDYQIQASGFARSYSLLAFLALVEAAALWRACCAPLETRRWIAYAVAGSAVVHTNYVAWLHILSPLPVIAVLGPGVRRRWALASGAIAASQAPWVLLQLAYAHARGGLAVKYSGLDFHPANTDLLKAFAYFNGWPTQSLWTAGLTVAVGLALLALAVAGAIHARTRQGFTTQAIGVLLMTSLALLPPMALWLMTRPPLNLPFWGIRHLSPSFAPWTLVVCAGVSLVGARARRALPAVAAGLLLLQGVATAANVGHTRFLPFHKMARFMLTGPHRGAAIFSLREPDCAPVQYYLPPGRSVAMLPADDAGLPSEFWLMYAAADPRACFRLKELSRNGWSPGVRAEFQRHSGAWEVVSIVLMERSEHPGKPAP